jgi:hypothetical protein
VNLNVIAHKEPINLNASISRTLRQMLRKSGIFRVSEMDEALFWQCKKLRKSENIFSKSSNNAQI